MENKKNILVFGAAGFMGTYLTDALVNRGYRVTASDINETGEKYYKENNIPYYHVDITDKNDFKKLPQVPFDAVIHLAATQPANVSAKNYDPVNYINVNVSGTLNILKYCKETGAGKIIYASSHRNTQGLWVNNEPITENMGRSVKFDTEYTMFSISESAAQDCVSYYAAQQQLQSIIFRLPPVYGYGPHTEIFKDGKPIKTGFQVFIDQAKACKPLQVWGNADNGRDIVYVKDVIEAFIKAISSDTASGLYNITSGYRLTLKEEAETIARVFWGNDDEPEIIYKPEIPNTVDCFLYDISRAKKELGWEPAYNFKEILLDFIKEGDKNTFGYLLEKRKDLFNEG